MPNRLRSRGHGPRSHIAVVLPCVAITAVFGVACSAARQPVAQATLRGCEVVFLDTYNPLRKYLRNDVSFICPLVPDRAAEEIRYGTPVQVCVDSSGDLAPSGDSGDCTLRMRASYIGWARPEEPEVQYVTPEFSPAKLSRAEWWMLEGKSRSRRIADLLIGEYPTEPRVEVIRVVSVRDVEGVPIAPK